jgi:nitrite reductase (cytochrome c-552)
MSNPKDPGRFTRRTLGMAVAAVVGLVGSIAAAALLVDIAEKKAAAARPSTYRVVELDDTIEDPEVWGKNYPVQYGDYMKTAQMVPTKHGGSHRVERTPTADDPRTFTSQSKIEEEPRLAKMWAGYPFSADFREERGHRYNFDDQAYTKRQLEFKQPGTCLNCHASTYVGMMKLGEGDLIKGFEKLNAMSWDNAAQVVKHPVACVDCHDAKTMELRVTRPGFIEGIKALKASQGIADYDVNRDASRQEMRTNVCGQCHVEYYFKGDEKRLVFPWAKGVEADKIYDFYTGVGFTDWTHKLTGSKNLKAQHPEYEMFSKGIHARSGVACADCHMPFKREGSQKVSDHHVRSPLLNVNRACQSCHKQSEEQIVARVHDIQDRHKEMVNRAFDSLMALIDDLERAKKAEGDSPRVQQAREFHRKASWYLDFVEAENSVGFHAPQEAARLLTLSIDSARQGQLVLSGGTLASTTEIKLEDMRNPPTKVKPAAPAAPPPTAAAGMK